MKEPSSLKKKNLHEEERKLKLWNDLNTPHKELGLAVESLKDVIAKEIRTHRFIFTMVCITIILAVVIFLIENGLFIFN